VTPGGVSRITARARTSPRGSDRVGARPSTACAHADHGAAPHRLFGVSRHVICLDADGDQQRTFRCKNTARAPFSWPFQRPYDRAANFTIVCARIPYPNPWCTILADWS
jgi:hypothetical protein